MTVSVLGHLLVLIKHGSYIFIIVTVRCFIDFIQWHLSDCRFTRTSYLLHTPSLPIEWTRPIRHFTRHLSLHHSDNTFFLIFWSLLFSWNSRDKLRVKKSLARNSFFIQSSHTWMRLVLEAIFTSGTDWVQVECGLSGFLLSVMCCIEYSFLTKTDISFWTAFWFFYLDQWMITVYVLSARLVIYRKFIGEWHCCFNCWCFFSDIRLHHLYLCI